MPLSERVRIEIFIPDPPSPAYQNLLDELASEFSYSFGGCTQVPASGLCCSSNGQIVSDKIKILFADAVLRWERNHLALGMYVDAVKRAAQRALLNEEAVLVSVHPVCHGVNPI